MNFKGTYDSNKSFRRKSLGYFRFCCLFVCFFAIHLICYIHPSVQYVQLFATPWTAARQASLSITISWSLLKLMSIESVMSSNHLILCHLLLLLPSISPSIIVFSNESVLHIRWPEYRSFSSSISPSKEYSSLMIYILSVYETR